VTGRECANSCGHTVNPDGPLDDFCGDVCRKQWHTKRCDPVMVQWADHNVWEENAA